MTAFCKKKFGRRRSVEARIGRSRSWTDPPGRVKREAKSLGGRLDASKLRRFSWGSLSWSWSSEKDMHHEGRLVGHPRAAYQSSIFGHDQIGTIASLSGRMNKHQPSAEDRVPPRRGRSNRTSFERRIEIARVSSRAEKNVSYPAIHFASGLQTTGSLAALPCLSFRCKSRH
jgi:hypothetical protein